MERKRWICCLAVWCLLSPLYRLLLCLPPLLIPFDYGAECSLVFGVVRLGEMPSGHVASVPWGVGVMQKES